MQPNQWDNYQPRSRPSFLVVGLNGFACGIIGVLAGRVMVCLLLARSTSATLVLPTPVPVLVPRQAGSGDIVRDAPARVAKDVGPTVVTVVSELPSQDSFFGSYQPPPARGSGVIIDPRGYVITNNHVVAGAERLYVVLADGRQQQTTLVGTDAPFSDLALVKIDGDGYPAARLGDSDTLAQGEWVVTIGSALGDFRNTVTIGV